VARRFQEAVVEPIRAMAHETVVGVASGILDMFTGGIPAHVLKAYRQHLFGHKTLQDLPADGPDFVMNATNLQTGTLWRFSRPYMRDYLVGEVRNPALELAVAVAASSAFPPVLSPVEIELKESDFMPNTGSLQEPPYTTHVFLADGGVYDNLGLETAWKRYRTILVSDGGGKDSPVKKPPKDWARQSVRILEVIDNQVRSLRKRQVIYSYTAGIRDGAYWGVRTDIRRYGLANTLDCPLHRTTELALVPTGLERLPPEMQERLINWGYAACDAALRAHVDKALPAARGFVYPGGV
jgi:NTE family protein